MRIFAVPAGALPDVERELRVGTQSTSTERSLLAPTPTWSEIVRGQPVSGVQAIAMESGRLELKPGALRLLGRCWAVPLEAESGSNGPTAGLRIEMVPQQVESRAAEQPLPDPLSRPTTIDPAAEGLVFERLRLILTATSGVVYVVVAEKPGVEWPVASAALPVAEKPADRATAPPPSTATASPPSPPKPGQVVRGRPAPGAADAYDPRAVLGTPGAESGTGPLSMSAPTLGEALLMSRGAGNADGPARRTVLVLVPRVPSRFRLIGD